MFQNRIRERYDQLAPGFRRLADFIMNNTLDTAFLTVTEVARRVGIDPTSVVRFSQELGYSGFRELSQEIKRYVRNQVTATYRRAHEATTDESLLQALQDSFCQNLQQFTATEIPTLSKAVSILKQAPHTWVAGESLSHDLANFLANALVYADTPASAFYPGMTETPIVVSKMHNGDALLAIVIGQPGVDTGYALRLAREKAVHTICLTTSGTVLAAREAEVTIVTPIESHVELASFGVPLIVMILILEALAGQKADRIADLFTEMYVNMSELRAMRAETALYDVEPHQET